MSTLNPVLPRLAAVSVADRRAAFGASVTLLTVLAAAAALRFLWLDVASLTHDEAWRANFCDHGTLEQWRRLPLGPALIWWLIQHAGVRAEWALRLPAAAGGTAAVVVTALMTRRAFGVVAAIFAAAYIAVHPEALVFSRMVKELAFDMALCPIVLWAAWRAWESDAPRDVWRFWAASLAGLLFGFAPILMIGPCAAMLFWTAYRRGDFGAGAPRRRALLVGATAMALVGVAWWCWFAYSPYRRAVVSHFSEYENAWPAANHPSTLARWGCEQGWGFVRLLAGVTVVWEPLATALLVVVVAAGSVGIEAGARPLRRTLAVLLMMGGIMIVAGALRLWPFGPYRNNVFAIPLAAMFIGAGAAHVWTSAGSRALRGGLIVGLIVIPAVRAVHLIFPVQSPNEHLRPVIQHVQQGIEPGDAFFVYYATDDAFEFYWPHPPVETCVQPRSDRGHPDLFNKRLDELAARHDRVWIIASHPFGDEHDVLRAAATDRGALIDACDTGTAWAWCIQTRAAAASDASAASSVR